MPELGAIHEDVGFDWLAAGDLAAEMRAAATALEDQVTERETLRATARAAWLGRFADEFDTRVATAAGDAGRFVASLRDAADRLDELARLAREEQDRRVQAREWEAAQSGGGGGLLGSVPVVGDVVDAVDDLLTGEDVPPPPPPVEPPAIPIGDPGVAARDAAVPLPTLTAAPTGGNGDGPGGTGTGDAGATGGGDTGSPAPAAAGVSSARPADLEAWAGASRGLDELILTRKSTLERLHDDFTAALTWGSFDASSLIGALGAWLTWNEADARWVSVIALAFTEAGTGQLADAVIEARLDAAGLDAPRGSVTYDHPRAWGEPPTAGWAGDPVNTASGNLVEAEVDLEAHGLWRLLRFARTYNSRSTLVGPFGPGWASWASVRLRSEPDGAHWTGPDGQELVVPRGTRGAGFLRMAGLPGRVALHDDGLALLGLDGGSRIVFGPDGRPRLADAGPGTEVRFDHDPDGRLVRIRHAGGKTVTLCWDLAVERVHEVLCSDGRHVTYRYDGEGRLVEVDGGPRGRRRYELDEATGRLVAVVDADGVVEVRNSYDDEGRVVEQVSAHGRRTRFRYLPGRLTVTDDEEGGPVDSYVHDDQGRLVGAVDGHGNELTRVYDRWGQPVRIVERDGTTTHLRWDDRGRLARREAPDGSWFAFEHDDQGRVTAVVASTGATTRFAYEGAERAPARITDPEGAVTRCDVQGGLLRRVVDPDGVSHRFGYDDDGELVSVTDGLGNLTTIERDAGGRVVAVVTPMGRRTEIDHDAAGRPVCRRDPDGALWRYEWSPAGRLLATVDPLGARRELRHGAHGDVEQVVDELGHVTTHRYDPLGNLVGVVLPDGAKWELTYDRLCRLTGVTDPAGGTWLREYDPTGRLVGAVDPVGRGRRARYDAAGRLTSVDDGLTSLQIDHDELGRAVTVRRPDGAEVTVARDRCGRVVAVTDPAGGVERYRYTEAGRLAAVTSPGGATTRYEYDRAGRLATVIDPSGSRWLRRHDGDGLLTRLVTPTGEVTRFRYDDAGRLVSVVGPNGGVTRYRHDPLGRLVGVVDPTGGTTRFGWDAAGRLRSAVDPRGGATRYEHDARGLLTAIVDPLGGRIEHRYDPAGRLVERRDQLGRSTHWERDPAGRPLRRILPTGEQVRWWYDDSGRVRAIGDADGERVRIERDVRGRPVVVDDDGHRIELEWDARGRLVAARRDGTGLTWRYDADGRRVAVGYPDGQELTFRHDPAGRVKSVHHPALGGEVRREHDAAGRLVGWSAGPAGTHGERWVYRDGLLATHEARAGGRARVTELERDAAGRVVAATVDGRRTTYDYDDAGHLVAVTDVATGDLRTFAYDEAGRLLGEDGPDGVTVHEYDAAHQLVLRRTAAGVTRVAHDEAGRRVSVVAPDGTEVRYGWDWRGRLAEVDGTRLEVDALGDLVDVDGMALRWDRSGGLPLLRWYGGTAVLGHPQPFALVPRDGDPVLLAPDAGGTIPRDDRVLDPWGAGPPGFGLGYRGELEVDGLVWLRNRAYDPVTRSFLSPDPLPGVPGTTVACHPYHYAGNDPIGAVDPLGLRPMTEADLAAYREAVGGNGLFDRASDAWDATTGWVADNWEYLAAGALVVAGGFLLVTGAGVVLGGALLAGGMSIGSQRALTGEVDWGRVGVDMLVGGASAGVGAWASGTTATAAATWSTAGRVTLQLGASATVDVAGGMVHRQLIGQNPFDADAIAFDATTGVATGSLDAARTTFRGPRPGTTPHTVRVAELDPGMYGMTAWNGDIYIRHDLAGEELRLTLRHEQVHSALSPTPGTALAGARAEARRWLYRNSHLYAFAEEAMAETYATGSLRQGLQFPFSPGYDIDPVRVGLEAAGVTGTAGAVAVGVDVTGGE
ncbi:MAG TPA: DUF6531 domain-containing protein [Acidimicrobiales bacterium]